MNRHDVAEICTSKKEHFISNTICLELEANLGSVSSYHDCLEES